MHKYLKRIVKSTAVSLSVLAAVVVANTGLATAIPYTGENTPPSPVPAFNVYTGVPSEGNEADFFKGKVAGSTADSVNNVESTCETGKRFQLRVYVHNGADADKNDNGNGPSVAKNTKVKVALPGNDASNFTPRATISSSNAASVSDTMTIRCTDGRVVKLKYVTGTAEQYSPLSGVQKVNDSIVTTGAAIGTQSPNGDMWGCWDQRVWVRLVVEVEEAPKPESSAACTLLQLSFLGDRRVRATVTGEVINAQIVGYEINWGDGATSNEQTAEHQYAPGNYTVVGRVQARLANGETKWFTSGACEQPLTFKEKENNCPIPGKEHLPVDSPECKEEPVTPTPETPVTPTTLPDTGAGDLIAVFTAVSAGATMAYRFVLNRQLS